MGLFDFAKKVGAKIFGASEAQAAPAEELIKEAAKHGLDTSGVNVEVNGDKVVLTGNAMSMEQAEKIILAMGNTMGVAQIENKLAVNDAVAASKMYTVAVISGNTIKDLAGNACSGIPSVKWVVNTTSPAAKAAPSKAPALSSAQVDDYWTALSADIKTSPVGLLDW